jgi:hypothetical protein
LASIIQLLRLSKQEMKGEYEMYKDTDWQVHLMHHKELLRQAEKERLVKAARPDRSAGIRWLFAMFKGGQRRAAQNDYACCQPVIA